MQKTIKTPRISFLTLLLMISFASVNAVLFTPALPAIEGFFHVSMDTAQHTISWFLIGYAIGQLFYGPIANRYGRKFALYSGISLQIFSSLLCIFAGSMHWFSLLVFGRFLLALGSGVGLKITFTLVNETYEAKEASQKISYLMLAFAVTPALSVALGGLLNQHFSWQACFYAGVAYGILLLILVAKLPETLTKLDLDAFKPAHLIEGYLSQFRNSKLMAGGFLMGACSAFVYVFAAEAPFVAINLFGMNSAEYGAANLLPAIGLITGSLTSARLIKYFSLQAIMKTGILFAGISILIMLIASWLKAPALFSLFIPMIFIYAGLALVIANASSVAMSTTTDKAHGSAVMNFINMGFATLVVLGLGFFPLSTLLMPVTFLILIIAMFSVYLKIFSAKKVA